MRAWVCGRAFWVIVVVVVTGAEVYGGFNVKRGQSDVSKQFAICSE